MRKLPRCFAYENHIHKVLCEYSMTKNTFYVTPTTGKYTTKNDIEIYKNNKKCGIEIKSGISNEYGQFTLEFNDTHRIWDIKRKNSKHSIGLQNYLSCMCRSISIWNDQKLDISDKFIHSDWIHIKKDFPEQYIRLPHYNLLGFTHDYIHSYYLDKNNYYIQIEKNGLFHLIDIFKFGTPLFMCETMLRVRFKNSGKKCKTTGKSIPSSIVASFRPHRIQTISDYSLDKTESIPSNL